MDHPDRPAAGPSWSELVRAALLDRVGLQGGQEPGMEVGQDQENRPGAHLPALAGAVGGDAAGPGLWHQSGRRQRAKDCAGQPAGAPQSLSRTGYGGAAIPAPLPVAQAKTDRQRHPPRHRLCGGCCSGAASGAGSGCCPNPGRNPSPTWRSPAMPTPENPIPTPVRRVSPSVASAYLTLNSYGPGIELDEDALARRPYQPFPARPPRQYFQEGP